MAASALAPSITGEDGAGRSSTSPSAAAPSVGEPVAAAVSGVVAAAVNKLAHRGARTATVGRRWSPVDDSASECSIPLPIGPLPALFTVEAPAGGAGSPPSCR